MKVTCGIDIIEISRVKDAIETMGDNFLNKIFTPYEIEYCMNKRNMKYQHFAARFAAKEAIFKAISDLLKDKYEITWTDVEIYNDDMLKPHVRFVNKNIEEIEQIEQIDISLSHIKENAVANCVVVSK